MKAVLDTCVLYPTVTRQALLAMADLKLIDPIWSPRILEEWKRIGLRFGRADQGAIDAEIAMTQAFWPKACRPDPLVTDPILPDENDDHVLALATENAATAIITANLKDFPKHALHPLGLQARGPDVVLQEFVIAHNTAAQALVTVAGQAQQHFPDLSVRQVFKKARLPRTGKTLERLVS